MGLMKERRDCSEIPLAVDVRVQPQVSTCLGGAAVNFVVKGVCMTMKLLARGGWPGDKAQMVRQPSYPSPS